jgi:hypothetical protein
MKQRPSLEAVIRSAEQPPPPPLMEPENSLPFYQKLNSGPYPESDETNSHRCIQFL